MATKPAWPSLSQANCQGTTNAKVKSNVKALQCLLNHRNGNTALLDDGDFGSVTTTAVKGYQSKNGLIADGVAGPFTLSKLVVNVRSVANGQAAKAAQHLLGKFATILVDGNFGATSDGIAKAFQGKMGLLQDGLVGVISWQYLFGYSAYSTSAAPQKLNFTKSPAWPTLSQALCKGSTNPDVIDNVKALQLLLNHRINSGLLADGDFGNLTTAAVKSFQSKNGLYVDGVAGPLTLPKLVVNVQLGASSAAAMAAQTLISKYVSLVVDGVFGPVSVAAAKAFQGIMKLLEDGSIKQSDSQHLLGSGDTNAEITSGSPSYYWGMDVSQYPGDAAMQAIWNYSPLKFTGFYLASAPCHKEAGWMSKFTTLRNQGWGIAPLYVGQNNSEYCPPPVFTVSQGSTDATNAITLAKQAGIPSGYRIYLDVETGGKLKSDQLAYVTAWLKGVINSGSYKAGVYCSYSDTADQISAAIGSQSNVKYWCYNLLTSLYGNSASSGTGNLTAPNPAGCGFPNATIWQLTQQKSRTYGSVTVNPIDISSSTVTNPGLA